MTKENRLLRAASRGDFQTAKELLAPCFLGLDKGADVNAKDNIGQTSLMYAASGQ